MRLGVADDIDQLPNAMRQDKPMNVDVVLDEILKTVVASLSESSVMRAKSPRLFPSRPREWLP